MSNVDLIHLNIFRFNHILYSREELLNEEDLKIVKLRGFRNISFTSPTDKR